MERMALACGGQAMNTFEDLDESCLGYAGVVYEHVLGISLLLYMQRVFGGKNQFLYDDLILDFRRGTVSCLLILGR